MTRQIDPERLRTNAAPAVGPWSPRPPKHGQRERFLKGPVPWAWLEAAGRLPGQALAVGLVLWQRAGVAGRRTIPFCQAGADELGLGPASARRAIKRLEAAGLIAVHRRPGRGLEVTLLGGGGPGGPAARGRGTPAAAPGEARPRPGGGGSRPPSTTSPADGAAASRGAGGRGSSGISGRAIEADPTGGRPRRIPLDTLSAAVHFTSRDIAGLTALAGEAMNSPKDRRSALGVLADELPALARWLGSIGRLASAWPPDELRAEDPEVLGPLAALAGRAISLAVAARGLAGVCHADGAHEGRAVAVVRSQAGTILRETRAFRTLLAGTPWAGEGGPDPGGATGVEAVEAALAEANPRGRA